MERVAPYLLLMVRSAGVTLEVSLLSLLFSILIGVACGLLVTSRFIVARFATRLYIEMIRSVPLLVLIFFAYYAVPVISNIQISPYEAATGALSAYGGAFMAEVVRSGIESVGKDQWEGARSLGFRYWMIMALIVFPQAVRVMVPAGIGIFINIIKGSSVTSIIGFVELMQTALNVRNAIFSLSPILVAAVLYFCICFTLSRAGLYWEKAFRTAHVES